MGLDLKILVQKDFDCNFSQDVLTFDRDYLLFDVIQDLEKKNGLKCVKPFNSYLGSKGYGKTQNTPYGDVIKSVTVQEFKDFVLLKNDGIGFETNSKKNNAILAFINELDSRLKLWIYWH